MAILMRRGASTDFYASRMTPGEFAIDTDTGEVHYCYQAGKVKTLATKEELQQILDDAPEAYEALQELISALNDQTVLSGILSDITTLKTTMGSTDISQIGNGTVTGALSFLNEGNNVVFLTMDEYTQLPDSKLTDGIIYYITDTDGLGAQNISYDNADSGMTGTTVQAAVDELAEGVGDLENDISELNGKLVDIKIKKVELSEKQTTIRISTSENHFSALIFGDYNTEPVLMVLARANRLVVSGSFGDAKYADGVYTVTLGEWSRVYIMSGYDYTIQVV